MTRDQMEHLLRAAAAITRETDFVIVGSQALLASVPDLKPPLNRSMELDLYPSADPSKAMLIDGTIGELSPFDETFGCYAHGVGPETAILPHRWKERAVIVVSSETGGARGTCPGPADLAISKLAAGRDKDITFVEAMIQQTLVTIEQILPLLEELPPDNASSVRQRMERIRNKGVSSP